ncbi:MAG: transaldolase family protein [Bacteroidales bacterium]
MTITLKVCRDRCFAAPEAAGSRAGFYPECKARAEAGKKIWRGCKCELHTDTAHNIDDIVSYGLRYHEICPGRFIIKVPHTASGLIGARLLVERGVRINFTLGFSARQNVIATHIARPDYLNVFLGRIGAYIADNKLGDGSLVGERAVIETQKNIHRIARNSNYKTRLIAASLRNYSQLETLAGTDLYTMPPAVASQGRINLSGQFSSCLDADYQPVINTDLVTSGIIKFWRVLPGMERVAIALGDDLPAYGDIIEKRFREAGFNDIFPLLSDEDYGFIASDSKIPKYSRWADRIKEGKNAPDTLLNLAGLASFTADQGALDSRIESMITR